MNRTETADLLHYLAVAYQGRLRFPTGTPSGDDWMILVYRRILRNIPADIALAAADKFISQGTERPPLPGQLAAEARKLVDPRPERTGLEGWEELQRAFARYSPYYQYSEFVECLSEEVRGIVRMIGINTIDNTDPAFMQHRFVKLYEEQQKRTRELDQIMEMQDRLQKGETDKNLLIQSVVEEDKIQN